MIIKGKRWNIQKKTEEIKDNNTKKFAKREKKAIKPVKVIEEPVVSEEEIDEVSNFFNLDKEYFYGRE